MILLRQPPVDQDDARGRRLAGMARVGALLALLAFAAGTTALMDWGLDGYIAQLMPLPSAFEPAAVRAESVRAPTLSTPDVPRATEPTAPTEPTEDDASQQTYVTHGG